MSGTFQNKNILRVIDANFNRVKEGLRVCEETSRFILNNRDFTAQLKKFRHSLDNVIKRVYPASKLLKERKSESDVGRLNSQGELDRANCKDIFWANLARVKESLRVLEEFSKLTDNRAALRFKQIRYKIYEFEKKSFKKISALPDSG